MTRLLVATGCGVGCYFAATTGHASIAIALAVIAALILLHVAATDLPLILGVLRVALLAGASVTGLLLVVSIDRDHIAGAAPYAVLLVLCVVGLMVKPASDRTIT